jgi:hypothetical protein
MEIYATHFVSLENPNSFTAFTQFHKITLRASVISSHTYINNSRFQ